MGVAVYAMRQGRAMGEYLLKIDMGNLRARPGVAAIVPALERTARGWMKLRSSPLSLKRSLGRPTR